jgi:hypothetical protein
MSKGLAVVFLAAAVGLAWFAYSKVTEARRESAYREALAAYQRDLRLGTYRAEGQKYLDSRTIRLPRKSAMAEATPSKSRLVRSPAA